MRICTLCCVACVFSGALLGNGETNQEQKDFVSDVSQVITQASARISGQDAAFVALCSTCAMIGCYLILKRSHGSINKLGSALIGSSLVALGTAGVIFQKEAMQYCKNAYQALMQLVNKPSSEQTPTTQPA